MRTLVVVYNPQRWPIDIPDVEVVAAREYLTDPSFASGRHVRVINLCGSYRYQSSGYYVSLLAAARGHKPTPSVATIQELKASEIVRIRSDELDGLIQKSLGPIGSSEFVLSVYFGKNLAQRHARLAARLFAMFHAPMLRASFTKRDEHWQLSGLSLLSIDDVPDSHREFLVQSASEYLRAAPRRTTAKRPAAYDLAVLWQPDVEEEPPSDERAIAKFAKAARELDMELTVVERDDYARLAEFDALFIRETTAVNHYTYRFARRAAAEGLVVIDDPESILRCTNKVYLAELLARHGIAAPRTVVAHKENVGRIAEELGFPVILKQPDSAFSRGVVKARDQAELDELAERMLSRSELVIAQQFVPTEFDWRIGLMDGRVLWACKYYMARRHWQIVHNTDSGARSGKVEAFDPDDVPPRVIATATRAAKLIGDGLYGVDLKQVGSRVLVVEVNDNPSIEAGYEDGFAKDELYRNIMRSFRKRLDALHPDVAT